MQKTDQEPEHVDDLAAPAASNTTQMDPPALEAAPSLAADQSCESATEEEPWDSAAEEQWNQHSTTAWALAHVIHRVRSTPHPPILPPEQRRHFEKVVEQAAALIEEWQGHERDQARQLGMRRPVTELPAAPAEADQDLLDTALVEGWGRQAFAPPYQLLLGDDEEEEAAADGAKRHGTPAEDQDYQI